MGEKLLIGFPKVVWILLLYPSLCKIEGVSGIGETRQFERVCTLAAECSDVGGSCTFENDEVECDLTNSDICPTFGCTCCINCTNQANARCRRRYAGSCKKACDDTELEIPGCEAGCKCCGCKITTACINEGGYCKVGKGDCKGRMTNKCFGRHCYCCIPDDPCPETLPCEESGGYCAEDCSAGEVGRPGLCESDSCLCCVAASCKITKQLYLCKISAK
nr:uncharacterized protein LOC113801978 [Penaeus vannamei]